MEEEDLEDLLVATGSCEVERRGSLLIEGFEASGLVSLLHDEFDDRDVIGRTGDVEWGGTGRGGWG